MNKMVEWPQEMTDELKELIRKQPGLTYREIADRLTQKFGRTFTRDQVRSKIRRIEMQRAKQAAEMSIQYKETIEIHPDGSQSSNRLLRMSFDESKNPEYLLRAHGYDPGAWELISARNNIWNTYSKQDGIQTLYGSRITVKPRKATFDFAKLLETIRQAEPVLIDIQRQPSQGDRMLEIPIFDAHFGVSDYDYYRTTQSRILEKLTSRHWQEVFFIIGSDLFHNDDMRGRTAKGTQIEQVDMVKAWEDCRRFYEPLIETALKQTKTVLVMYCKGNHDESMSWAFVQYLKARFPQAEFDDGFQERKAHVFGKNFIGVTHGDKARKNLHNIFPAEFPLEWSKAKNREIHTGHYHAEDGKDYFGMMVRTLATRNKTDQWSRDMGFVGAHKRFMLFEYSMEELESIHYV